MQKRLVTLLCLQAIIVASGCTHRQLRWNTTHQARTLTEIYEQQVLDNLARFVHDPNSLPSFAFPNAGGSDVTDSGSVNNDITFKRALGFDTDVLKLGASRNMKEGWTMTPIYDVRRLELMKCAYQHALFCTGCCTSTSCCPDCDKLYRTFYLGNPNAAYNASTPQHPNDLSTFSIRTGRTTPGCFEAVHWLGWGRKKDIPKDCNCQKIGRYCDTYVWVNPCGQNELTKLTLTILDYAFSPQATSSTRTKDVTMYFDRNGNLVSGNIEDGGLETAIEIKTTVPFDKPVPTSTIEELNKKPFDLDNLTPKDKEILRNKNKRMDDLIGKPETGVVLPRMDSPQTGVFSPLQFELYRNTLTTPDR